MALAETASRLALVSVGPGKVNSVAREGRSPRATFAAPEARSIETRFSFRATSERHLLMTGHQEYPAEWAAEPQSAPTPYDHLAESGFEPSAALRARVADVVHRYVARDAHSASALVDLAADLVEDPDHRAVARALVAVCELIEAHTVGPQGAELAVGRLESEVHARRELATWPYLADDRTEPWRAGQ